MLSSFSSSIGRASLLHPDPVRSQILYLGRQWVACSQFARPSDFCGLSLSDELRRRLSQQQTWTHWGTLQWSANCICLGTGLLLLSVLWSRCPVGEQSSSFSLKNSLNLLPWLTQLVKSDVLIHGKVESQTTYCCIPVTILSDYCQV